MFTQLNSDIGRLDLYGGNALATAQIPMRDPITGEAFYITTSTISANSGILNSANYSSVQNAITAAYNSGTSKPLLISNAVTTTSTNIGYITTIPGSKITSSGTGGSPTVSMILAGATVDGLTIVAAQDTALQLNASNCNNNIIVNSHITGTIGYGILDNDQVSDSLIIANNIVVSGQADAVELNHPNNAGTNRVVTGCILESSNIGSASSSGFAFGVAAMAGYTFGNSCIRVSRQQAIHIEDNQFNGTVSNIAISSAKKDGIHLLYPVGGGDYDPVMISNVSATHTGGITGFVGHNVIADGNGQHRISVNQNSYFKGFDTGIVLGDTSIGHFDGCVVNTCNYGIFANKKAKVVGTFITETTPVMARAFAGACIDGIISRTTPTTILSMIGTTHPGATMKRWEAPYTFTTVSSGSAQTFTIAPIPAFAKGTIQVVIEGGSNAVHYTADLKWLSATLTMSDEYTDPYGNITVMTFTQSGGNLLLNITTTNVGALTAYVRFDGRWYVTS